MEELIVEGRKISITNPDKMLWEEAGIYKIDYIQYLLDVAPFLLEHAKDRLLMIWIYPHGIDGKRIEKRSLPSSAPEWVNHTYYKEKQRILLNDNATLAWAANYGALEFHVPFDSYKKQNHPLELVFDLDPPDDEHFEVVLEISLKLKNVLRSLGLTSVPRTSGSSGMQIFVPIASEYSFEETRKVNKFIADYLVETMQDVLTLQRAVNQRENKVYFDYLQLWKGRTMPAVYSPRAKPQATVATPVTWEEVQAGFHPTDFTISNINKRIRERGDLFSPITTKKTPQNLDDILTFIKKH